MKVKVWMKTARNPLFQLINIYERAMSSKENHLVIELENGNEIVLRPNLHDDCLLLECKDIEGERHTICLARI